MSDDTGGGLTLGERIRRIEDLGAATLTQVSELNARDRADHVRLTGLDARVSAVESSVTWLWRSVVGAVIVAVIGVLLTR